MKKGFTLIELLAVIVILAIIAIIAVPIVLNIINDSKKSSLLISAESYLDASENAIANAVLNQKVTKFQDDPSAANAMDLLKTVKTFETYINTLDNLVTYDEEYEEYFITDYECDVEGVEIHELRWYHDRFVLIG
mgnify:CR=1 FL=1